MAVLDAARGARELAKSERHRAVSVSEKVKELWKKEVGSVKK